MFEPITTGEHQTLLHKLNVDLMVWKMSTSGNFDKHRECLLKRMQIELHFAGLHESIVHCSRHEGVFVDIVKLIPFILHLRRRRVLKTLQMIFGNGLELCGTQEAQLEFTKRVEEVMNKEVLVTVLGRPPWSSLFN
jgi:hypothetical protein